jgi:hypothetical protein
MTFGIHLNLGRVAPLVVFHATQLVEGRLTRGQDGLEGLGCGAGSGGGGWGRTVLVGFRLGLGLEVLVLDLDLQARVAGVVVREGFVVDRQQDGVDEAPGRDALQVKVPGKILSRCLGEVRSAAPIDVHPILGFREESGEVGCREDLFQPPGRGNG